jgi:translocator assembly and maintenance protein 41
MKNEKIIHLKELIFKKFPKNNFKFIFAYGSAAIPQKHNKGKMIDIIYIVEDIENFHKLNMDINPLHYSKLARLLGSVATANINESATKVYYNPSIMLDENINIKYGVVSIKSFINNLTNWPNLFLSGRLHKPIINIYNDDKENDKFKEIINKNREAAVIIL